MSLPRAPAMLPADFAAELGHAVAGFGFLEEALKRAIYALSRDHLGATPDEAALDAWVMQMEEIADDSLGTLIDAFVAACVRRDSAMETRARDLGKTLRAVRDRRNMLCHASWRPLDGGGWRPGFVSSRGIPAPDRMVADDLAGIQDETLAAAREVVAIARTTGNDRWSPDAETDLLELEGARAEFMTRDSAAGEGVTLSRKSRPDQKSDQSSGKAREKARLRSGQGARAHRQARASGQADAQHDE